MQARERNAYRKLRLLAAGSNSIGMFLLTVALYNSASIVLQCQALAMTVGSVFFHTLVYYPDPPSTRSSLSLPQTGDNSDTSRVLTWLFWLLILINIAAGFFWFLLFVLIFALSPHPPPGALPQVLAAVTLVAPMAHAIFGFIGMRARRMDVYTEPEGSTSENTRLLDSEVEAD